MREQSYRWGEASGREKATADAVESVSAFLLGFAGLQGSIVDRVVLPEPVPCRGYQRLWWLPEDVAAAVEAQVARYGGEK